MYEAFADPYCYPGTEILKNLPGLRDAAALERFEAVMTAQRTLEPLPGGALDVAHYQAIHHHLFQDVYGWAGEFRSIRIAKGSSMFCYPENIPGEMQKLFGDLSAKDHLRGLAAGRFVEEAAHFLAELNAVHPFREGNGRSQLAFLAVLGHCAGHPLALHRIEPVRFLAAMIGSFGGSEGPLAKLLMDLIDGPR